MLNRLNKLLITTLRSREARASRQYYKNMLANAVKQMALNNESVENEDARDFHPQTPNKQID